MRPAEATALLNASRELLSINDAVGAERVLSPLMPKLKSDAEALHLMGLIKRTLGHLNEAERFLRSAVAYSLSEGGYYNDLAVVLQALGQREEAVKLYRAALALTPEATSVRVNMVRCYMESDNLADAEREARAYVAVQPNPESWLLLSQVQRALERHEESLNAAAAALKLGPKLRGIQYNYALALDNVGRAHEALEVYRKLAAAELDTPDLALNLARGLYAAGEKKDAETTLEIAVGKWPGAVNLHVPLARMRALRGDGENATALLEADMARRPKDLGLRLACADVLHRGRQLDKALNVLDAALNAAPDNPALLTAHGIMLDELDRPAEGLRALRRVAALSNGAEAAQRNMLSTLIRAGEAQEALQMARKLRESDPDEQYLIACEALALRALGDPAYKTFADYDRLVRRYEIPAPRNFFTVENFNASFADLLRRQHRIAAHPLDQTLHNGSQTPRTLLALEEPIVAAFKGSMDVTVRDYISRLRSDENDPVGRRKRDRYRFSGLWSTRLGDGGWQPNQIHDRGWISGVYWVARQSAEKPANPHAGWLKFGEPNRPVPGCTPERAIEPKVGQLVLFPS
ncbi:MAG: tetratricopeptide repeat protein, partial [Hyphomonadaceae bacterium]|nr:tetratricopeptide repeat protein [Hyphomonadaceae bacterium]